MAAPPLDSPCDGSVTYPGDIKITRKILERKKRTDTQYDNKAKFDERFIILILFRITQDQLSFMNLPLGICAAI